jgi:hypothetical protein
MAMAIYDGRWAAFDNDPWMTFDDDALMMMTLDDNAIL